VNRTARWVFVVAAALLVVGLLIWARGNAHHHGDDVGSLRPVTAAAR
jgi:phosphate/sulfate permease